MIQNPTTNVETSGAGVSYKIADPTYLFKNGCTPTAAPQKLTVQFYTGKSHQKTVQVSGVISVEIGSIDDVTLTGQPNIYDDWLNKYSRDPMIVNELCVSTLGLLSYLKTAVQISDESFKPDKISIRVQADPQENSQWLVIDSVVHGTVNEVLDSYDKCKRKWLNSVPLDKSSLIRFVYDIA